MSAPAPTSQPAAKSAPHKPILAERFKSKMCKNFETTGTCPYEARCMFAHGEHELRTKTMNLADNLTSEEAIKAFQKARNKDSEGATAASTPGVQPTQDVPNTPDPEAAANSKPATPRVTDGIPKEQFIVAVLADRVSEPVKMPPARIVPSPLQMRDLIVKDEVFVNYDSAKYVSPLAAAMLCRTVVSEACHCDACSSGRAHHIASVLLA